MIITPEGRSPEGFLLDCLQEDAEYDINNLIMAMAVILATRILEEGGDKTKPPIQ